MIHPFRLLGSLRVAVTLLITIAGVLAWGTIYETRFGTASVQRFVYQSGWFQTTLVFLAVNLAAAAFLRFPWKRKHLPFLLAHLGIILILIGGILGGWLGVEGRMIIPEGESNGILQMDRNVLVIHQPNPGVHQELPTHFEATAWNHTPHALFEAPLEGGRIHLVVDRYYPNADRQEAVTGDGERANPAIRVVLSHEGQEDSAWLFARDPDRFGARWGEAHVFFLRLESERQLRQMMGRGRIPFPPDSIVLLVLPEGRLAGLLIGRKGERKKIDPLRTGQPHVHPSLGCRFTVSDFYPRARVEELFTNRDNEVRGEAIRVTARIGDQVRQTWLGLRGSMSLPFGQHPVVVEYRPALRELPFSVRLLDFRKIDYPGTEMAAAFESDVELTDPERGVSFKKKISMNNPLKHRGYSLFQSSFIPGPVETTVLSVRKDPGVPLVYSGFLIVLAGVTLLFTSRRMTTYEK